MSTYSITGDDTFAINGHVITDFADGDISTITFPNKKTNIKTGKNQNSIFARNMTGYNAEVVLRVMRGSGDDKFLSSLDATQENDFAAFTLLSGEFTQRSGDGKAGVSRIIYPLQGGTFDQIVDGKGNVEGETDQGVAIYRLMFAVGQRQIQ